MDLILTDPSYTPFVRPVIPLIYNDVVDTSTITNLLLIDSIVADAQLFYDSANSSTFPIIYSYSSTIAQFTTLLTSKFTNLERISFAFHDSADSKLFLDNKLFFTDLQNTDAFSPITQLLIDTIRTFSVTHVDFLACDSLTHPNWVQFYNLLNSQTGVIVGASNDRTGNLAFGGDWLMENTNENVLNTYFNSNILNYTSTLANNISASGTIQIQQSGVNIQYSVDAGSTWANVVWPASIVNSSADPSNNRLTVLFTTDLLVAHNYNIYFITGSQGITYDGNNKNVSGISDGLIQNGVGYGAGYSNITVQNINSTSDGYNAIQLSSGFICWLGFGGYSSNVVINNCTNHSHIIGGDGEGGICGAAAGYYGSITISNCTNYGNGSNGGGGICGSCAGQSGSCIITNCTNYGTSYLTGGGICGASAGLIDGTVIISNCTNYGEILYNSCGGICGQNACNVRGHVTITNCINNGIISGIYAGGICGKYAGFGDGFITITNCINTSTGIISGSDAGGICGFGAGNNGGTAIITNCINEGTISGSDAGGICGKFAGYDTISTTITSCYSTGDIIGVRAGGICGSNVFSNVPGSYYNGYVAINNCYSSYNTINGSPYYASVYGGGSVNFGNCYSSSITAWSDTDANVSLLGYPTDVNTPGITWTSTNANTPYVLTNYQPVLVQDVIIGTLTISTKTFGDASFDITDPSSNSAGAFSYTSSNTSVATVSGATLTIIGAGQTTITANQAAFGNYTAGSTTATFQVNQSSPTIGTLTVSTKTFGDASFDITDPSSNSAGAFSYTSSNTSVATVSGSTLTIIGAGQTTITANQVASGNYITGTTTSTFQVDKLIPTVGALTIPTKTFGEMPFVIMTPTTNGIGSFSYTSSNISVSTVSGSTETIVKAGTTTITATQAETANYTTRSVVASFQVLENTFINPAGIVDTIGLSYFLNTTAEYGVIQTNITSSPIIYGLLGTKQLINNSTDYITIVN